jgi:hypothetical protein
VIEGDAHARRTADTVARRRSSGEAATGQLQILAERLDAAAADAEIPDRRLALMFACAHPAIAAGVRAPLMLQVVLGLDAKRIASAFLMSPAAIGKRLVRAKSKIRQAGIPFRIPEREQLPGCRAPAAPSKRCQRRPPMRGSPNTNPTGPRARSCWPGQARTAKPAAHTGSRSVSSDPAVRRFLQRRQSALPA